MAKKKSNFENTLIKAVQTKSRAIALKYYRVATNVIVPRMSPVWSGQFVSSWKITAGKPKEGNVDLSQSEKRALANSGKPLTPMDARKALPRIKKGKIPFLYVTNAVDYAGTIQKDGTLYSDPDILGRIKDAVRFS